MQWTALPVPECDLAESPRYSGERWVWVDIKQQNFYELKSPGALHSTANDLRTYTLPDEMGCVLPTQKPGIFAGFGRQGIWQLNAFDGAPFSASLIEQAPFNANQHRFNDGRADDLGRAWVSSLVDARTPPTAALYRWAIGQRPCEQVSELIVGNGLAFSPDYTWLYLCDTRQKAIWRYSFHLESGKLGERELLYAYTHNTERPDGALMMADGTYCVAVYEGYRLDCFNAQGKLSQQIELPLARPTMPCLGGEHLNELLVCSAKADAGFPNKSGFENVSVIVAKTLFQGVPEPVVII